MFCVVFKTIISSASFDNQIVGKKRCAVWLKTDDLEISFLYDMNFIVDLLVQLMCGTLQTEP